MCRGVRGAWCRPHVNVESLVAGIDDNVVIEIKISNALNPEARPCTVLDKVVVDTPRRT